MKKTCDNCGRKGTAICVDCIKHYDDHWEPKLTKEEALELLWEIGDKTEYTASVDQKITKVRDYIERT